MTTSTTSFENILSRIRAKLPIQNPLHTFVHNNILQMFESKDFHAAVEEAGKLYRAQSYWSLPQYLEKFEQGKINEKDIFNGIDHYLAGYADLPFLDQLGLTGKEFYYRLMFSELLFNDDDLQPDLPDSELWNLCKEKMAGSELVLSRSPKKWRGKDFWERYHNINFASSLNPLMIRMISSYLDQGQSFWTNPFVNKGFWNFFSYDFKETGAFMSGWMKILGQKITKYQDLPPAEIIVRELETLKIPEAEWESYLLDILFDLKGWSGMVNKLELEPWQATVKAPNIKLVDYLAAFLLMETSLDQDLAQKNSLDLSLIQGRVEKIELKSFQLALALYQITKSFKLDTRWMQRISQNDLLKLIDGIDQAETRHRVRLWHEAFEHHFFNEALEAMVAHSKVKPLPEAPYAQVLFCIDDREESIRRHTEEVDPGIKTYGVVGFFGIDMKFSSLKSQRLIAQCPPVITPSRIVREVPKNLETSKNFLKLNRFFGGSGLSLYYHSRTLFRGFLSTLILGTASIVPMFMQVFFPKEAMNLKKSVQNLMSPEPLADLMIEAGEVGHGYSKLEMAKIVKAILDMCGFKNEFTPLVVMMGHGSTSTNNPFRQAYGCGACGGNAGIPNSRAFAMMANDKEVRVELKNLGIMIPDDTFFVSGFHDTCTDEVQYFNRNEVPKTHLESFEKVRATMLKAGAMNAFERCQRFSSTDALKSPEHALAHVKERALDLAQPRPEYGHSTNALAIVGKREFTKGLFLNRRSFLLSYDWETDPSGEILKQVVLGGIPVAVNINMDYYFSCVDNDNFGCGSKLPLNLTSLLGVMTGSQGDLRIGLARQMVEIHEPIRNMTVIEAPLERVQLLFKSHPRLKNILEHHWFRLVVHDPQSDAWLMFGHSEFKKIDIQGDHMRHFSSSMDLLNKVHTEEDFAEIDHD